MDSAFKSLHFAIFTRNLDFVASSNNLQFRENMRKQINIGILATVKSYYGSGFYRDDFFHVYSITR